MKKTVPILLLVVLFAAAAWYSFVKEPDPIHELPPTLLPPIETAAVEEPEPYIEDTVEEPEPEAMVVPSPIVEVVPVDDAIRQAMSEVVGSAAAMEYLVRSDIISRLVATVDNLDNRQVPPLINPVRPVSGTLSVEADGERTLMSVDNYSRYDGYVGLLQETDAEALAGFYNTWSHVFQDAWVDNGGEGLFHERLLEVLEHLQQTPDVPGPVYLTKPEAVYLFEDSALEAMSAGQKILVRMGSANAAVVKQKLQELEAVLTR